MDFHIHLALGAGPSEGSCLRCRKEMGEKPPRTKERMQEPAVKELYWRRHDPPTGSLRHPHRTGRAAPKYLQRPGDGVQRGVPATPMLSMLPEARGCKKRWIPPGTIIKGLETIPFSKALPCPVQSTYWEHWADRGDGGMRAGWAPAAKRREGREGWRRAGR